MAVTIAITVLLTLIMTALSSSFGGFGSDAARSSDARGLSTAIILHLATAIPALILGPVVLLRRKGDTVHRWLGRIWVALMLATAIASAFIHSPGAGFMGTGYSFIHIFTIWTLVNAPLGVWLARKGKIDAHRGVMKGLYAGLVIAGATTLIPGRLFGTMLFL
jgi:uncharacterized membrane protein